MKKSSNHGFTVYLCIGRYGGFGLRCDMGLRIGLGWIAVAILYVDIEMVTQEALSIGLTYKAERDQLLQAIMNRGGGSTH